MILGFLNLCFVSALEIRTVQLKEQASNADDFGLSDPLIRQLADDMEFDCLTGKDITQITKLTNGSSSEAVFRIETENSEVYIIKSTRAPFVNKTWQRSFYLQQNGKSAERTIVSPQQAMANFIQLSNKPELTAWNETEKRKNSGIRLLVSLPIELVQVKGPDEQVLHLEIFEAAKGKSLAECIKEPDKTRCAQLFEDFGRVLARFHTGTGLTHGDSSVSNIFVSPDGLTFTLIDGNSIHTYINASSSLNPDAEKLLLSLQNAAIRRPSLGIEPLIEEDTAGILWSAFEKGYSEIRPNTIFSDGHRSGSTSSEAESANSFSTNGGQSDHSLSTASSPAAAYDVRSSSISSNEEA